MKSGQAVFLCPEQLGGLTTPREPTEIERGKTAKDVLNGDARVLTKTGKDVTDQFVVGAHRILEFCQRLSVEVAILKSGSPSCGSKQTYDGSFTDTKIVGKKSVTPLIVRKQELLNVGKIYMDRLGDGAPKNIMKSLRGTNPMPIN